MKSSFFSQFILPLAGFLFIFSVSVVLVLNFRPLYYYDMKAMHLAETNQMSEEEIKENYDTLISYNSVFYQGELDFPTLPMSREGRIHFQEVKQIFDCIQILLIISLLLFFPGATYSIVEKKKWAFLNLIPCITGIVLLFIIFQALMDWDGFFTTFHHLLFQNDYWLFDPATDPVINLLPDEFFFHCLVGIAGIMTLLVAFCVLAAQILKRHMSSDGCLSRK